MFPTRKMSFFDLFGNLIDYAQMAKSKGVPLNVYILQLLLGYHKLFQGEHFCFFWLSYIPNIIIISAEAVEKVIAGSKNIEKGFTYNWLHSWLGTGLLTSHGVKWKSRRKLLTPSFHFDILKDFLVVFNEQSQLLIKILDKQLKQPWIDIVTPVTLCSLDIICETTLGVSIGAQNNSESEYVQAVQRASEVVMQRFVYPLYFSELYFQMTPTGFQNRKDIKLLHSFTRSVITDKKNKLLSGSEICSNTKRKALMDLLLEQHISKQALTEEDIREEIDTFAFEGHDTTSMGISWALYLIGLHKDVQEKVHTELDRIFGDDYQRSVNTDDLKDMEYLDRVLKESQRLYPSVPMISRKLSHDVTLGNHTIPKGVGVFIPIYLLHRDEAVFPNPEKFDPDRFLPEISAKRAPFSYIPFSAGPRNCIGQRFAIMEEKVVVASILRNFCIESLDHRDKILLASELILRASTPIRVKLTSRRISTG